MDHSESHDKARLIQRILQENGIPGASLIAIGDGPVEIQVAVAHGALALGVASDEVARQGWNERKIQRLSDAGADLLIPDFRQAQCLVEFLFPNQKASM